MRQVNMFNNNPYYTNPMPYNPIAPMQQRLQQYEQMYNDPTAKNLVKCRAVTSIDEAKAAMIDLDGSMTIFTDLGNKKIYTKQINLDGTATLNTYVLQESSPTQKVEEKSPEIDYSMFVKQNELDDVCRNFSKHLEDIDARLQQYERTSSSTPKKSQPRTPNK